MKYGLGLVYVKVHIMRNEKLKQPTFLLDESGDFDPSQSFGVALLSLLSIFAFNFYFMK